MRKKREKEQQARSEVQQKAKMTREELGGHLLLGIRAEQLDASEKDSLKPKNRISRLSMLGADKLKSEKSFNGVPESEVAVKLPPRWQRLLDADFTVDDWKNVQASLEVLVPEESCRPGALLEIKKKAVDNEFWHRCYEDEDTMKLIYEAYKMGAADANAHLLKPGPNSFMQKVRETVLSFQGILNFLIQDHEERVNPIITLTPRELTDRIVSYFIECDLLKRFYTVPGLAFHIGFASRDDLQSYIEDNSESINVHIIKRAFIYIESERVVDMLYGGGLMAGHKLDLATNFNYNDAGKKSEAPASQTNITVNNNTLSMNTAPPKAASIEEWQAWYVKEQESRKSAAALEGAQNAADEQGPVIETRPV